MTAQGQTEPVRSAMAQYDTTMIRREHFKLSAPFVAPATDIERQLTRIWEASLDVAGLGVEDDYFELGGDSLIAVTLFAAMEIAFGAMPPLSTLLDYPTIRKLAGRLEQLGAQASDDLLLTVQGQGRRWPLFYAHAAYGNVLYVRRLTAFLTDQPLYAIQARGLVEGETPHKTFGAMAADYGAVIRKARPKGPYVLAGHCAGALIAYEMALRLTAEGEDIAAVIMIDPDWHPHAVPWLHWRNPSAPHIRLWRHLLRAYWYAPVRLRRAIALLRGRAVKEVPEMAGTQQHHREAVIGGIRAAFAAYRPGHYDGKVFVITSAERRRRVSKPRTGWGFWAPRTEFVTIPASHDEFFVGALPEVAGAVEQILVSLQPAQPLERNAAE
jgi:thioesterase domain-containing protein/acyl carrier protein